MTSESIHYDILIVGGGPAGLAFAVAAKQTAPEKSVIVIEKGAFFGAHALSGAIIEPQILNDWLPEWKNSVGPVSVKKDSVRLLTKTGAIPLPGTGFSNKGNQIVPLGKLVKFLAAKAEALGVDLVPGAGAETVMLNKDKTAAVGVKLTDGTEILSDNVILAEGSHGYLSEQVMEMFQLRKNASPQTYALGIKEIWEIPASKKIKAGDVYHFLGWPLGFNTYGGGFLYAFSDTKIAVGLSISLDYQNPTLDPFFEMQRFKTHPFVAGILKDGKRTAFGARTMTEGGYQALPEINFPGGMIVGDSLGLINAPKIKGLHNVLRMSKMAGEKTARGEISTLKDLQKSIVGKDLWQVRNVRPSFQHGFLFGLVFSGMNNYVFKGYLQPTLGLKEKNLEKLSKVKTIAYEKTDGVLTFDKPSSVYLANLSSRKLSETHLKLKDKQLPVKRLKDYGPFDTHYCPAEVYVIKGKELHISPENCIHCKTCSIRSLEKNITWTPPGNTGPSYNDM